MVYVSFTTPTEHHGVLRPLKTPFFWAKGTPAGFAHASRSIVFRSFLGLPRDPSPAVADLSVPSASKSLSCRSQLRHFAQCWWLVTDAVFSLSPSACYLRFRELTVHIWVPASRTISTDLTRQDRKRGWWTPSSDNFAQLAPVPMTSQDSDIPSIVHLNVGGAVFATTVGTLTLRDTDSMLAVMFSGRHRVHKDPKKGTVFIDRDGTHFRHVLNWLRDGVVPTLEMPAYQELLREAHYYQLTGLIEALNMVVTKKDDDEEKPEMTRREVIKCLQFKRVRLRGVNLSGQNLSKLDLTGVDFSNARLINTFFSRAMLQSAKFRDAEADGSNFQKAILRECVFIGAFLRGAVLSGANLQSANMQDAILTDASFCGADLRSAHLQNADLTNANLSGAILEQANLKGAKLKGADLRRANLQRAYLRALDLRDTKMEGANLEGANLQGASRPGPSDCANQPL